MAHEGYQPPSREALDATTRRDIAAWDVDTETAELAFLLEARVPGGMLPYGGATVEGSVRFAEKHPDQAKEIIEKAQAEGLI